MKPDPPPALKQYCGDTVGMGGLGLDTVYQSTAQYTAGVCKGMDQLYLKIADLTEMCC